MAGAIEDGVVTPDTVFDACRQSINVGGTDYEDVEEHSSTMTVADILAPLVERRDDPHRATSSARTASTTTCARSASASRPALGLPGRGAGRDLRRSTNYTDTSMGSMPIGYGIAVTAMQMLDVYPTIANHGMARPPRLVAATIDADGKRHDEPLPRPHQVVSPATADAVNGMLQQVVNEGTGTKAADPGLPGGGQDRHRPEGAVRHRRVRRVVRRVRARRRPPAGGDRGARRARRAASSAPTPPPPCSSRSCGSRSPTSGCRRREPAAVDAGRRHDRRRHVDAHRCPVP